MNPQQELTLTKVVIGALRGLIDALQGQEAELQPRAIAFQRTALDARAIHMLRDIAIANGSKPDWAERRYWLYIDAGYVEQAAFDEVCAELESA